MMRGDRENLPVEFKESAPIDRRTRRQALLRVVLPVALNG
jgi:ABC-type glycerol-3-phosphate transport system permease component